MLGVVKVTFADDGCGKVCDVWRVCGVGCTRVDMFQILMASPPRARLVF